VDHGDGGTAALAATLGARTVVAPNLGFGAGQNRGVALGDSEVVLLLNPDAEVRTEAVSRGLSLLLGSPGVAAVQGAIVNRRTGELERSQGRALGPVHLLGRASGARALLRLRGVRALGRRSAVLADHVDRRPADPVEVESLAATALLVRRVAFEEIGGFDERYFLYGEDLDLCRRLRAAGGRLLAVPDDWAVHDSGASAASAWDRELRWWEGTMVFAARWWARPAWGVGLAAACAAWIRLTVAVPRRGREAAVALLTEPIRLRRSRG
ncbi:MAG TPA: glycosyltransferase family 2 protein, partial [Acidimicrobiales bacterium]|nr:glycosyltransferase family 2 protein [Acidimicrobiales bacterium]